MRPYTAADLLDGELRVRAHRNEAPLPPPQHVVDAVRNVDGDALRRYPADLQRRVLHQLACRLGAGALPESYDCRSFRFGCPEQ
jgi:histidinol-phosphate/aromatic aminotransferase/cobyric acid decarboxylase-like protein